MRKREIVGWILVNIAIISTLILTIVEAAKGNARTFFASLTGFLLCSIIGAVCGLFYADRNL